MIQGFSGSDAVGIDVIGKKGQASHNLRDQIIHNMEG